MKKRLEVNGVIIILAALLVAVFPGVFFRSRGEGFYDTLVKFLGVAFILLGQTCRVSARGYKAEHSRQGAQLIQGGPYAIVRNPMYLGILLIGLGVVLLLFKWWAALLFLAVFALRYIRLIFTEEKKLLGIFPQEYPLYLRQVPRLLPDPVTLCKKNIRDYLPIRSYWLKKELGTMLAVLLPALLLTAWLTVKSSGVRAWLQEAAGEAAVILLFAGFMLYLGKGGDEQKKDTPVKS